MKNKTLVILMLLVLVASFTVNDAQGMARAKSFFSAIGTKTSNLFGKARSTFTSCASCYKGYAGRKPPDNSELPLWHYVDRGPAWTEMTLAAIDREGLTAFSPKDMEEYCPNWNSLTKDQRRTFWLQFSAKLCEIESDFTPTATYREKNGTLSNGLFSMSVGDECGMMHEPKDTFDEKKNIDCAIRTMRYNLQRNNYVCKGLDKGLCAYWGPLRPGRDSGANLKAYTKQLLYCRR
ncbi:hypothetical protein [Bdellovibrio reynosensis]|uniref:Transglycosylase SLT domain-containing protein n=1 Tax=Bdellovibrio reynosensis TaxID=2835041 RepID=A0ABY4C7K7_9BACT|nr:hypothetical protein [Bdellovibrio reynosensis]UOF00900.1 hypothetical protein MNR06_14455 [Bdellovibrio reynosensis]